MKIFGRAALVLDDMRPRWQKTTPPGLLASVSDSALAAVPVPTKNTATSRSKISLNVAADLFVEVAGAIGGRETGALRGHRRRDPWCAPAQLSEAKIMMVDCSLSEGNGADNVHFRFRAQGQQSLSAARAEPGLRNNISKEGGDTKLQIAALPNNLLIGLVRAPLFCHTEFRTALLS